MSASPYGRNDVHVAGGMPSGRVTNPKRIAEIERDSAELVRLQQEARARLLGPHYKTGSHALASAATEGGIEL
jgi:hypothetical protein